MRLSILNDVHIGVRRSSGTTVTSRLELGNYLHESLRRTLNTCVYGSVVVNGDLFDGFQVEGVDLIRVYETFADWLHAREPSNERLILIAGNHDYQAKAGKVSSFDMLCHFLVSRFGDRVMVITHEQGLTQINDHVWAIPHMPNQDLFDIELEKAVALRGPGYLLLHCNVMSTFAEESDHSLNISSEQIRSLDVNLVIGHEHQGRDISVGNRIVTVVGNQFPSSIADCLAHGDAQRDGTKHYLVVEDDLSRVEVTTWKVGGNFVEMDWQQLEDRDEKFVRITGDATTEQAAEVINAVARYRARSSAYVVSNAVRIEGIEGMEQLAEATFDNIHSFDVFAALLEGLSEDEAKVVKELMNA